MAQTGSELYLHLSLSEKETEQTVPQPLPVKKEQLKKPATPTPPTQEQAVALAAAIAANNELATYRGPERKTKKDNRNKPTKEDIRKKKENAGNELLLKYNTFRTDLALITLDEFATIKCLVKQGNAEAQFLLGRCYLKGSKHTHTNYDLAVDCFRNAKDRCVSAKSYLAHCLLYNRGLSAKANQLESDKEAFALLSAAILEYHKDIEKTYQNLATCYLKSRGTEFKPANLISAYQCYVKANYKVGKEICARLLLYFKIPTPNNPSSVKLEVTELLTESECKAIYALGMDYKKGTTIERNPTKAFKCFMKASLLGDPISNVVAVAEAVWCYKNNFGVPEAMQSTMVFNHATEPAAGGSAAAACAAACVDSKSNKPNASILHQINLKRKAQELQEEPSKNIKDAPSSAGGGVPPAKRAKRS